MIRDYTDDVLAAQVANPVLRRLAATIRDEGPITGEHLVNRLGIPRRQISRMVRALVISHGIPIGGKMSGRHMGYYLLRTHAERQRELAALRSRVIQIAARMRVLEGIHFASLREPTTTNRRKPWR